MPKESEIYDPRHIIDIMDDNIIDAQFESLELDRETVSQMAASIPDIWTSADGRRLRIDRMDLSHVQNATKFIEKKLRDQDEEVRAIGRQLVKTPENLPELTQQLTALADRALQLEKYHEAFRGEAARRNVVTEKRRASRGEDDYIVQIPEEKTKETDDVIDNPTG